MVGESGGIKVYNATQQTGMLLRRKMFLINCQVEHQHSVAKWSAIYSFLLYSAASLHLLFQMCLLKMAIWSLLLPIFLFLHLAMETQCKVHVCIQLVRCLTAIFTNIQTLSSKATFTIGAASHKYDHKQQTLKHRNTQNGSKSTRHQLCKPWPFKPVKVKFCSLRGPKKSNH